MAWEEQWDEYNDVPVWVNRDTNLTSYEKPRPPLHPLMPKSMIGSEGKPLSLDVIRRNEADTSSDSHSEVEESIDEKQDDINSDRERTPPPVGREGEIESAKKRVLERRMQVLTSRK